LVVIEEHRAWGRELDKRIGWNLEFENYLEFEI